MSSRIMHSDFLRVMLGEDTVMSVTGLGPKAYAKHDLTYKKVSDQRSTDQRLVEIVAMRGLPVGSVKGEGEFLSNNKMSQHYVTRAYIQVYQSNYIATYEALGFLSKAAATKAIIKGTAERAESLAIKKDLAFGVMLNNYDTSTVTYGDGKVLGATDHPNGDGSTYSNIASAAASINEASIIAADRVVAQYVDGGGKAIRPNITKLVSGTHLKYDAERLLRTEYALGNNDNDVNLVKSMRMIPGGAHQSPHIANDGSWFLLTDVKDGLITANWKQPEFGDNPVSGNSFDVQFWARDAYVHTMHDPKSIFVFPRI